MSDSVLDRIRQNRQRAVVPPRDDILIGKPPEASASSELQPVTQPDSEPPLAPNSTSDTLEDLKAELATFAETTRHSAIVLEKDLDQILTRYCKDNRITVEVFLEAAWMQATSDPTAMAAILVEAKRRYGDRKKAGKLRRLITMLEGQA